MEAATTTPPKKPIQSAMYAILKSLNLDLQRIGEFDALFFVGGHWVACKYAHVGYDACHRNTRRVIQDFEYEESEERWN